MGVRAEVFISATTRELRSYREEVKNALLSLQIFPIEQISFQCDVVMHLAGFL